MESHLSSSYYIAAAAFETDPKVENQKTCFIDFHDKSASIICFAGEKLLSVNTFPA